MAGAFSSAFSNAFDIGSTAVTIAGNVRISRATQYFRKTLSELREEEKARLEKLRRAARRRVAKALREGKTDEGLLERIAKAPFVKADLDWLTVPLIDELAQMIVAAMLQAALNDEDDAEAILLLN